MRRVTWAVTASVALAVVGSVGADEQKDLQALIDRALKAAGGVERLTQPRAYTYKEELITTTRANPTGTVAKTTYFIQPPDKSRLEGDYQEDGKPLRYIQVINGKKGWATSNGVPRELASGIIARPADQMQHSFGYKFILHLRDPANTAALLGESRIGDRVVTGVKLTRPSGRQGSSVVRQLFFDNQSAQLVKYSGGSETGTQITWEDYRTIDGIAVPHRVNYAIKNREELTYLRVYSDFKFVDKLDPKLFEKP